jgi:hypothetical protein
MIDLVRKQDSADSVLLRRQAAGLLVVRTVLA